MEKVNKLIDRKIAEHKLEIEKLGDFKQSLKDKLSEGMLELKQKDPKVAKTAMELLILNEKVSFHQTCISCLSDLKKELNNG